MTRLATTSRPARFLAWLIARDQAYRAARTLATLPEERLRDMGMSRADRDTAFRRHPVNRAADLAHLPFGRTV